MAIGAGLRLLRQGGRCGATMAWHFRWLRVIVRRASNAILRSGVLLSLLEQTGADAICNWAGISEWMGELQLWRFIAGQG